MQVTFCHFRFLSRSWLKGSGTERGPFPTCLFLALALDEVRRGVWPTTNELLTHFKFDFATHYHTTCLYNCGKGSTFDQSLSDLFRQCSNRLFLLAPVLLTRLPPFSSERRGWSPCWS